MSGAAAYLVGRKRVVFPLQNEEAVDALFAGDRLDGVTLEGRTFNHCTFANVSFKEAKLRGSHFDDCAFVNCYFRRTQLVNCSFVGAKFIACDFPKPTVQSSDFRYSRFEQCAISFDEMEHSLPREPNLREDLAVGLAIASEQLGFTSQARRYRLAAIDARENHLYAAIVAKSNWYKDHYQGTRRLEAFLRWLGSRLNGLLWGHGERWLVLLRNLGILSLVLFPAALWWYRAGLDTADGGEPGIAQILWLSVTTTIPVDGINTVAAGDPITRSILTVEAFLGVIIAGLFVTLLVRSRLRR